MNEYFCIHYSESCIEYICRLECLFSLLSIESNAKQRLIEYNKQKAKTVYIVSSFSSVGADPQQTCNLRVGVVCAPNRASSARTEYSCALRSTVRPFAGILSIF